MRGAQVAGVASEKVVSAGHLCQDHPEVIGEVRRILSEHAAPREPGRPLVRTRSLRRRLVTLPYYVTPTQLSAAGALADRKVRSFSAVAHDGTVFTWSGTSGTGPLILVFIRRGCPCNVELELILPSPGGPIPGRC